MRVESRAVKKLINQLWFAAEALLQPEQQEYAWQTIFRFWIHSEDKAARCVSVQGLLTLCIARKAPESQGQFSQKKVTREPSEAKQTLAMR